MKYKLALICGVIWSASFSQFVFADEWSPSLPKTITLLHETKLYASPNELSTSWASLTPQDVQTVEAEMDWYKPFPNEQKWVKIHTNWLGDQWVHIDFHEIGRMTPKDEFLDVLGPMPLFTKPECGYTGATLASQIVHTKGIFYRPLQNPSWLLDTWLGDKWFTPSGVLVIEGVSKVSPDVKVNLQGTASLFNAPENQPYIPNAAVIEPQLVSAIAQQGDFYKVTTNDGKHGWVSHRYEQPTGVELINTDILLPKTTNIYAYPNLQSFLDPLAPQTVHAHAKVQDIWGNTWFQIRTWVGDAWILHNDSAELNPNKIPDNNGYIDVFPKTISGDKTVCGRLYVMNMPQYESYGGFSFTLQMIDSNGNLLASAETSVSGVQQNDDISFTTVLDKFEESFSNYTFRLSNVKFIKAY
ncbi:hypothetical protein GC102_28505 [Paenibacillus sp. LMG 31460]|uniref:SH3 domain-containing protein n=1 Tax=Paenibacillus germinis TaxID=2654979 RepID=A0ABX1ZCS8_9BACL|nr:hypothetical protein [Paenibacillus germinis]NOU89660.1 hypothetical protein [Paenibacillus germinis]